MFLTNWIFHPADASLRVMGMAITRPVSEVMRTLQPSSRLHFARTPRLQLTTLPRPRRLPTPATIFLACGLSRWGPMLQGSSRADSSLNPSLLLLGVFYLRAFWPIDFISSIFLTDYLIDDPRQLKNPSFLSFFCVFLQALLVLCTIRSYLPILRPRTWLPPSLGSRQHGRRTGHFSLI